MTRIDQIKTLCNAQIIAQSCELVPELLGLVEVMAEALRAMVVCHREPHDKEGALAWKLATAALAQYKEWNEVE